jgi:hypothetical protein
VPGAGEPGSWAIKIQRSLIINNPNKRNQMQHIYKPRLTADYIFIFSIIVATALIIWFNPNYLIAILFATLAVIQINMIRMQIHKKLDKTLIITDESITITNPSKTDNLNPDFIKFERNQIKTLSVESDHFKIITIAGSVICPHYFNKFQRETIINKLNHQN